MIKCMAYNWFLCVIQAFCTQQHAGYMELHRDVVFLDGAKKITNVCPPAARLGLPNRAKQNQAVRHCRQRSL